MLARKSVSVIAALVLSLTVALNALATPAVSRQNASTGSEKALVEAPLNLAILVQDDLVSRVGSELDVTRDFIRSLPAGSRVMVAYITTGTLQVRQSFTDDLEKAAKALRVPVGSTAASPYNPYVEVIEALRRFDTTSGNRNAILLISDGLDTSRGFDAGTATSTIDLLRAIKKAKEQNVAVYSFYAPTVGLTSWNRTAVNYGQGALNRLSNETGGRAFFQGSSFVSFDSYFDRLRQALNDQYAKAY